MLSDASLAVLRRLLDTPGPSGFESAPAAIWRDEARRFAASVEGDVHGNSMAVVNPDGAPTIMLAGHIDEIGVIVTWIDDKGFAYIGPIGGWDPQVLVGQRLRFAGRAGEVIGVVGKKPIHLMKTEERDKAVKITDLWVDIGAASRAEAEALLSVGAYHGGGARVSAARIAPQMAIVVDVTFATDHPGMERKELGEHKLGGGPVLTRGSVTSPVVVRLLRDTAERIGIPYSLRAEGRNTSTDADAIHVAHEGVATGLLSVPNRYMHSPNEMVALEDLDRAATLIAEACRAVSPAMDFTAR